MSSVKWAQGSVSVPWTIIYLSVSIFFFFLYLLTVFFIYVFYFPVCFFRHVRGFVSYFSIHLSNCGCISFFCQPFSYIHEGKYACAYSIFTSTFKVGLLYVVLTAVR